ncbi:hypothetical protein Sjap_010513 [Stephania japonica]|uniref:Uncharacterized protein n=1 Tax=Stephania japonica TaxID=461633 RepID=A0AAP0J9K4_9MAGN
MENPGEKFSAEEAEYAGVVLDPAKCKLLSLVEKRELIRKFGRDAPKVLRSWSHRDLHEVICTELGKQKKYTGLTKLKLVELLLKLISKKENELAASSSKRQKMETRRPLQSMCRPDSVHPMGSNEELPCRIQVMLKGTVRYKEQHRFIDIAAKKLKREAGPLGKATPNTGHGLVDMLSCRSVVQKHCTAALESFHSMIVSRPLKDSPASVVVVLEYNDNLLQSLLGCKLWYQRATESDYPENPTYIVQRPERRFPILDLDPTEYLLKVSVFSICWMLFHLARALPVKSPSLIGTSQERCESPDKSNYEHCVNMIKKLEREGLMENNFLVKFMKWFCLRSSVEERRVVNAFVDALIDDPPSLVAQLVNAFADKL